MKDRLVCRLIVPSALAALLAAAGVTPVRADEPPLDPAAAQSLFDAGRTMMDGDRPAEACPKFEESNRLEPRAGTLLNLGVCYEALHRTATAWATYKKAISLGKSTGELRQAGAAEEYMNSIESKLIKLTVRVSEPTPGMSIERVDSRGVHTALAEASFGVAVFVDPDKYKVIATAPGFAEFHAEIDLETEGASEVVDVPALKKNTPDVVVPKRSGPDRLLITGVVLGSVGVVTAALGTGFGVKTLNDSSTALSDPKLCPGHACSAKGLAFLATTKTEATVSTVCLSLGIAAVAAGGGMLTWALIRSSKESSRSIRDSERERPSPIVLPAFMVFPDGQFVAGVSVRGSL